MNLQTSDIYFLMEAIRVIKNNPEMLSTIYMYLYNQLTPEDQNIIKEKLDEVSIKRFL